MAADTSSMGYYIQKLSTHLFWGKTMRTSSVGSLALCLLAICAFSGCATIVSGRHEEVAIRSNPPQAHVAVRNGQGEVVASGLTPMKVQLDRSKGILKKPPHYTATLQKPGYQPSQVAIDPNFNPWALGNIVLGGPLGLAADAASGAVWRMTPGEIHRNLAPIQAPVYSQMPRGQVTQATFVSDQ